ncbi:hypothetical protein HDU99_007875, partial [Rhizoclosmatium hyalinum]
MTQDDKIMDAIDTSRATLDAALQPSGIQSSKSSRVPSSQPPPPSPRPNVVHCHGRVDDLESMVPAEWWTQVFNDSMYLKTDGDVVEDPEVTKQE